MRVNPQGGMKSGLQGNPQGDLEGDFQGNPQCINLQCHPQRHARWSLKKLKKPTKSIYLNILFLSLCMGGSCVCRHNKKDTLL